MSRLHAGLNSRRWRRTRRAVFDRDGWRCVQCGKAGRLEADHVTPLEREPEQEPYAVEGCQTLCRSCHIQKTRAENRRPMTEAEAAWRAFVEELVNS